jgi:opacity protein-like surface antigen
MWKLLCCAASAAALIFVANAADTAAPKKKAPVPAAKTAAHKTTVPPKSVAASKTGVRTSTGARRTTTAAVPRRPATTWRNRQAAPTADRYKEIQDALAAKGYLETDGATGKWDQASIDALKKFQADQKLDSTGKINSLSLIALGLGPKYEQPTAPKPAEPPIGQ